MIKMHNINIFVVHSIFQDLIAQHMIKSLPELKEDENYLIYNMNVDESREKLAGWEKVITLDPVGGTVLGDKKKYKIAVEKVLTFIEEKNLVRVFLSDLNWPLNNAIYSNLAKKKFNQVELCNFPDGIANLYVVDVNIKQKTKNFLKSILGLLGVTLPYYNYKSDHIGLGLFDKIYSLMPSIIEHSISKEIIEIPTISPSLIDFKPDTLIFLGQPYELHIPKRKYRDLCMKAASFTMGLGYKKLYYKPHPREDLTKGWDIFRAFGFKLFNQKGSIEELFLTSQTECIISFNSSALVNLKLMFGDRIRCISYCGTKLYKYTGVGKNISIRLKQIYNKMGVEYYEN